LNFQVNSQKIRVEKYNKLWENIEAFSFNSSGIYAGGLYPTINSGL